MLTNVSRAAKFLNLSEQRVQQLAKEGILPREARGSYDPIKCGLAYIRYLQAAIEKRDGAVPDETCTSERRERMRVLRAQADLKEMQLAELRSQLVTVQDAEKEINRLVVTTTAHIMEIPARLAPDLVGETSRVMIHAKIERAVKDALSRLAKSHRDEISADPSLAKEVVAPNS